MIFEIDQLILDGGERIFDLDGGALTFSMLSGDAGFTGDGNVKLVYDASLEKSVAGDNHCFGRGV